MANLWELTIQEAHRGLVAREFSSVDLTTSCLVRIRQVEDQVKSFVTITEDLALSQAERADRVLADVRSDGGATPLTGIPMQIKDLISTKGIPTTCGSRMLESYVPPYDATVMSRLLERGAVILGKGNLDEFGMGSSCEHSAFFPTHNPWDLARVPGGSSGGAAAAVASGEVIYALGSDTGGSIRQPAALSGVVGLKPTYGSVSRYGLVAYASSLDQIGPLAREVADCALVLDAIAGHDPLDATSVPRPASGYAAALNGNPSSSSPLGPPGTRDAIRIGVPQEYFVKGLDPEVKERVEDGIRVLESLGASVQPVSLPTTQHALACYYIIAPSECSANLARYDGVKFGYSYQDTTDMWQAMEKTRRFGFGPEVKRRIMLGTYALSSGYYDAYYIKAQQVRTLIRREFDQVFSQVDALVTPTSPVVAFPLGEKTADPLQMYLVDVYTLPVNIAGLPGLSVPCGFSQGLPVGMQLIGPAWSEDTLLRIAHSYQQATEWHLARPQL